ncbi:hypothetical protein C8035_v005740 [Colletotrichum spinosum]|uniref:Uncharacterized protein n=1 Tax=Colletotrichum spinosum TaxID=1347390 RepID=A0A4R8QJI2_9PEZI|nr:hypothetical protein C8035_v005740 [Colletotrichum spinosum]
MSCIGQVIQQDSEDLDAVKCPLCRKRMMVHFDGRGREPVLNHSIKVQEHFQALREWASRRKNQDDATRAAGGSVDDETVVSWRRDGGEMEAEEIDRVESGSLVFTGKVCITNIANIAHVANVANVASATCATFGKAFAAPDATR